MTSRVHHVGRPRGYLARHLDAPKRLEDLVTCGGSCTGSCGHVATDGNRQHSRRYHESREGDEHTGFGASAWYRLERV